jgi:neurotransmitter:Na+ symporter, NSS family
VAAAIRIAVGTGNMCRFIRVAAEWGGGSFLIALVTANLVWAISTLMTTPFMGSESRLGTIGAFRDFRAGSREYAA